MNRRDALRLGALGVASVLGAPLLAACSNDDDDKDSAGGATSTTGTTSEKLAPFDATRPGGPASGLPKRVAWANTTQIGIFTALGNGMSKAADDRGLEYVTANAEGDPQANADQINTFLSRGIGGMTIQPLNPAAQEPLMTKALHDGICVVGIINHPCTLHIAASQYDIGLQQGKAAAAHIRDELGGKATVFNGNLTEIAPQLVLRNQGVLDGLQDAGTGVEIIDEYVAPADQTPEKVASFVSTLLQRKPDIKVVLGVDGFVLPAFRAFEQTRRLTDDMYFSSIDGDPEALDLVGRGGPYRASLAFAWTLMGYGMGRFVADWVDGKEIPRVLHAKTTLVDSPEAARRFLADAADPKSTFEDRARYEQYLPLLGNVSYANRDLIWTSDYEP